MTWNVNHFFPQHATKYTDSYIDYGDDSGFQDLANGTFTFDGWIKPEKFHPTAPLGYLVCKNGPAVPFNLGWDIQHQEGHIYYNSALKYFSSGVPKWGHAAYSTGVIDDLYHVWHHIAITHRTYDSDGIYYWDIVLYLDGVAQALSGNYYRDDIGFGGESDLDYHLLNARGAIGFDDTGYPMVAGWQRISSSERYTGDFTPDALNSPPFSDGNTLGLWRFLEGSGVDLDNNEGTSARDGVIHDGIWIGKSVLLNDYT